MFFFPAKHFEVFEVLESFLDLYIFLVGDYDKFLFPFFFDDLWVDTHGLAIRFLPMKDTIDDDSLSINLEQNPPVP